METSTKLSKQALNKLDNMSREDKIRLLARICVLEENKLLNQYLYKHLGNERFIKFKAEITHHLYDENDGFRYTKKFNQLQGLMNTKKDIYVLQDSYTLCAYALYYHEFLGNSYKAPNIELMRNAKEYSYHRMLKIINPTKLNFDYYEEKNNKTGSLIKKEVRKEVYEILKKDLKFENLSDFFKNYLVSNYDELDYSDEEEMFKPKDNRLTINQVEKYYDENGKPYYLDHEGELVDEDNINFNQNFYEDDLTK